MARASEENKRSQPSPARPGPATQDQGDQGDRSSAGPAQSGVNWSEQVEFLRGLAAIVRDEELSELSIEQAGVRLNLRSRRPSIVPPDPAPALPAPALSVEAALPEVGAQVLEAAHEEAAGTPIVSPMGGVFFRSKTPDDAPFVEVGERVEVGQVVGLIEAMKTFNEITSEVEGEVALIPARNSELVEAGATLVVVRAA